MRFSHTARQNNLVRDVPLFRDPHATAAVVAVAVADAAIYTRFERDANTDGFVAARPPEPAIICMCVTNVTDRTMFVIRPFVTHFSFLAPKEPSKPSPPLNAPYLRTACVISVANAR